MHRPVPAEWQRSGPADWLGRPARPRPRRHHHHRLDPRRFVGTTTHRGIPRAVDGLVLPTQRVWILANVVASEVREGGCCTLPIRVVLRRTPTVPMPGIHMRTRKKSKREREQLLCCDKHLRGETEQTKQCEADDSRPTRLEDSNGTAPQTHLVGTSGGGHCADGYGCLDQGPVRIVIPFQSGGIVAGVRRRRWIWGGRSHRHCGCCGGRQRASTPIRFRKTITIPSISSVVTTLSFDRFLDRGKVCGRPPRIRTLLIRKGWWRTERRRPAGSRRCCCCRHRHLRQFVVHLQRSEDGLPKSRREW